MPLPSYSTGTVSIAVGATVAIFVGASLTGVVARPGDTLLVAGHEITIEDVNDGLHLAIDPWSYAAVPPGTAYKIIQNSPFRFSNAQQVQSTSDMLSALTQKGLPIFMVEPGGVPDPSLGAENQYAEDPTTRQLWRKTGGVWLEQAAVAPGTTTFATLRTSGSVFGSYWSDFTPFTVNPIFQIRDRLAVDDGCLIPSILNGGNAPMPNIRAAAAINAAGSNWQQPPIRSSIFALSSRSQIAVSGMTNTALSSEIFPSQASQAAIGVLGMALADHPTLNLPAWGFYGEAARMMQKGFAFTAEFEIGNTVNTLGLKSVYAPEPEGITVGLHLYCGGALDQTIHTYYNASCALDIGHNNASGAAFDKGILFVYGSVADQGGGVFNAINFPSNYRINWFRNNSSVDQLQAFISAKNTTLGATVQSIEFGTSDTLTITASIVKTLGQQLILSGASGTFAALGIGRTVTEGGFAVIGVNDQVFTGTVPGDLVVEANTTLWLGSSVGGTAKPGIKIVNTTGLLTFPQYGAGILQTDANGIVSSSSIVAGGALAASSLTLESTSGAGTSDSVVFKTGSQVTRGSIATGGQWSFGPNAATTNYNFDFNLNSSNAVFSGLASTTMRIVAANAAPAVIDQASFASSNTFRGIVADGTLAAPTATTSGRFLHSFLAYGHDGTTFQLGGAYQMTTTQLWSGTARGLKHLWYVTPDSTTTLTLGMTLESSANLTLGGKLQAIAGTTAKPSINIPPGVAPTSPSDGDFWYDGTNVKFRVGGTTKTFTLT